jgi:hypothetical protein
MRAGVKRKMPDQTARQCVEVAGVEPASPELLVGLLRAQPLESVTYRQINGTLSAGQPRFYVPMGPEALPIGEPSWMTPRADE